MNYCSTLHRLSKPCFSTIDTDVAILLLLLELATPKLVHSELAQSISMWHYWAMWTCPLVLGELEGHKLRHLWMLSAFRVRH